MNWTLENGSLKPNLFYKDNVHLIEEGNVKLSKSIVNAIIPTISNENVSTMSNLFRHTTDFQLNEADFPKLPSCNTSNNSVIVPKCSVLVSNLSRPVKAHNHPASVSRPVCPVNVCKIVRPINVSNPIRTVNAFKSVSHVTVGKPVCKPVRPVISGKDVRPIIHCKPVRPVISGKDVRRPVNHCKPVCTVISNKPSRLVSIGKSVCPVNVNRSSRHVGVSSRPVNVNNSSHPVNVSVRPVIVCKSSRSVNVSTRPVRVSITKSPCPVNVSTRPVNYVRPTYIERKRIVNFFHLSALFWEFILLMCIVANNVDTNYTPHNIPLMGDFSDKFYNHSDVFKKFLEF